MEESNNGVGDEDEELCVVCCKDIHIFSIMDCQHTICHECSTRLRVLCDTLECPICRLKTTIALFSHQRGPFSSLYLRSLCTDDRYKVAFEDARARQAFESLLAHRCPCCPNGDTFSTFKELQQHVGSEHDLFYCEICVAHLKLFNKERKLYTRELLERHRRHGDDGDDSYSGHPLCDLCQQRYVDHEELFLHLRRDHYQCHLCEADDHQAFYRDVAELQEHFRRKHYLCEEGECRDKRLIVFRTNIDLQAHRASSHSEGSVGAGRSRRGPPVLTLQFSAAPDSRRRRADRRGSQELVFDSSSPSPINPESRVDFPSLAGPPSTFRSSAPTPTAPTPTSTPTSTGFNFNMNRRRPTHTNVTINLNRRTSGGAGAASGGVSSPTGTQARISQVSSSGNITMQSPTMEQPPLIRGGRLVNDLESLYGPRADPPPPPAPPQEPPPQERQPPQELPSPLRDQLQEAPQVEGEITPSTTSAMAQNRPPPPPQSSTQPAAGPRSYSGTNSVRFSVAGGGWTPQADPVVTSHPLVTAQSVVSPLTSQITSQMVTSQMTAHSPVTSQLMPRPVTSQMMSPLTSQLRQFAVGGPRARYCPPENLQARSCRLVKLARDLCRSEETLRTFRQLSAEFRCGQLSAEPYYSRCLSLLGPEKLSRLFPELLVLLPDIGKQTELLAAHEALNKDGSHRHKFLRCPTCGQILTLSDWGRHSALHFRNGELPPECQ